MYNKTKRANNQQAKKTHENHTHTKNLQWKQKQKSNKELTSKTVFPILDEIQLGKHKLLFFFSSFVSNLIVSFYV